LGKPFVVVSGLPGSGKTTLARCLAPMLNLPVIDKDDILERLLETRGIGDVAWRRALSRESDTILQHEAVASDGAILASFWRLPGMPVDSGTPTDWLSGLSDQIVNIHCICELQTAAERFLGRTRHPGHLDGQKSLSEIVTSFRMLSTLGSLNMGIRIDIDTTLEPDMFDVAQRVRAALARCRGD
jgi:glucokinase